MLRTPSLEGDTYSSICINSESQAQVLMEAPLSTQPATSNSNCGGSGVLATDRSSLRGDGEITSFANYMGAKTAKLLRQVHGNVRLKSKIFNGVSIYVNGHTEVPSLELRRLIVENGGKYHHYYAHGQTTYTVAAHISSQRLVSLRKNEIVLRSEWILESIRAGRLLSVDSYRLDTPTNRTLPFKVDALRGGERRKANSEPSSTNPTTKTPIMRLRGVKRKKFEGVRPLKTRKLGELPTIKSNPKEPTRVVEVIGSPSDKTMTVGDVNLALSEEPTETCVKSLMRSLEPLLEDLDFARLSLVVNRMERLLYRNEATHYLWLEVMVELKTALNRRCERNRGAKLFVL